MKTDRSKRESMFETVKNRQGETVFTIAKRQTKTIWKKKFPGFFGQWKTHWNQSAEFQDDYFEEILVDSDIS